MLNVYKVLLDSELESEKKMCRPAKTANDRSKNNDQLTALFFLIEKKERAVSKSEVFLKQNS